MRFAAMRELQAIPRKSSLPGGRPKHLRGRPWPPPTENRGGFSAGRFAGHRVTCRELRTSPPSPQGARPRPAKPPAGSARGRWPLGFWDPWPTRATLRHPPRPQRTGSAGESPEPQSQGEPRCLQPLQSPGPIPASRVGALTAVRAGGIELPRPEGNGSVIDRFVDDIHHQSSSARPLLQRLVGPGESASCND